jgi:amino acid transporter
MIVALIGGGIFVAVSYVTQLVHPGGVFEDSASAASSIALQIGGQLFGAVFLAGLVVAQFASGLAAQASASRLMYAMGRDSVLPKAVFGRLSEKFHTPVVNLVITGIIGLIAIFLDVATCGRWKSRWRRWSRCGSRSRCSGKEGCGTNCWPSKPQGIRRLPS